MRLSEQDVREIYRRGEDAVVGIFMPLQAQVEQLTARLSELEG